MSMRNAITFVLIIITLASCGQIKGSGYTRIIYSHSVKDSFELYITVPKSYDSNQVYAVFYYFDANLKSGKKLREMIQQPAFASRVNKTIFVGIGHRGDFHELRRRDFILPSIRQGDTSGLAVNYGQATNFYNFMKNELMPIITKAYKTDPLNNSIMGHSLGGWVALKLAVYAPERVAKLVLVDPAGIVPLSISPRMIWKSMNFMMMPNARSRVLASAGNSRKNGKTAHIKPRSKPNKARFMARKLEKPRHAAKRKL